MTYQVISTKRPDISFKGWATGKEASPVCMITISISVIINVKAYRLIIEYQKKLFFTNRNIINFKDDVGCRTHGKKSSVFNGHDSFAACFASVYMDGVEYRALIRPSW